MLALAENIFLVSFAKKIDHNSGFIVGIVVRKAVMADRYGLHEANMRSIRDGVHQGPRS